MRWPNARVTWRAELLSLCFSGLLLIACNSERPTGDNVSQPAGFSAWDWSFDLPGQWDAGTVSMSAEMEFARQDRSIRLALVERSAQRGQLAIFSIGADGQMISVDRLDLPQLPDTARLKLGASEAFAFSGPVYEQLADPGYSSSSFLFRVPLDSSERKVQEVKLPQNTALIDFDGQTVTVADPAGIQRLLGGQYSLCSYAYSGMRELTEWQSFRTTALIRQISEGPISYWLTGVYYGQLLMDADTLLPAPSGQVMGFIASRDLFGETKWARQLGSVLPGSPRKWESTRTLDLLPDPAGYAWVLWEGKPVSPSDSKSYLGISFYDPSGIRMKNFVFELELPVGSVPRLSPAGNEYLAITSSALDPAGKPLRQILLFDREGQIIQDTLLRFSTGEICLDGILDDRNFYYLSTEQWASSDSTSAKLFIRKKRYR